MVARARDLLTIHLPRYQETELSAEANYQWAIEGGYPPGQETIILQSGPISHHSHVEPSRAQAHTTNSTATDKAERLSTQSSAHTATSQSISPFTIPFVASHLSVLLPAPSHRQLALSSRSSVAERLPGQVSHTTKLTTCSTGHYGCRVWNDMQSARPW